MLSETMKRAGIVISALWVLGGGYYIYLQHSYQEHWANIRGLCALGTPESCAQSIAESKELFAPEWGIISIYVLGGLAFIWAIIFSVAWVQRGKTQS